MRLREELEEGLNHPTNKFQNVENAEVEKNLRIIAEILLDVRDLLNSISILQTKKFLSYPKD